jgi:transketolase
MPTSRPDLKKLIGKDTATVPMSAQRVLGSSEKGDMYWVGPDEAAKLSADEQKAHDAAQTIMAHIAVRAPTTHSSGHPGGPLSSFTFAYMLSTRRKPTDQPLRISAGHLSLLAYGLQWLFGRGKNDERLKTPQAIIENFRIPNGLPGHVEAGIGDIPFGTGPLGKGVSNALGVAFGLKHQGKEGMVDVLLADGDAQEGQVAEAFRLASHLKLDNLVVHGDWNDIQLSDIPSKTVAADFASIAHAEGWNVIEVQNGNDPAQVKAAQDLADTLIGKERPVFICYYTTMGNGISFMEEGSNTGKKNYHGSPLSKEEHDKALTELPSFEEAIKAYEPFRKKEMERSIGQEVEMDVKLTWKIPSGYKRTITADKAGARKEFGATHLKNMMKEDKRIMVLHADLAGSGGFDKVQKEFPDRVINVGVAEANMYMMAAGMRQTGLLPVTYTFAAFGTNEARANARLIDINCAHTRCGVIHDCTHAGLSVGEDGETHQEQNYLNIPFHHTQVWMPGDSNQAGAMAEKALEIISEGHESVYVFSPRSDHDQVKTPSGEIIYGEDYMYDGKIDLVRGHGDTTDQVTILTTGSCLHNAIEAADKMLLGLDDESVRVRVLNVSCIKPIDAAAIIQAALETVHLIVVEDHNSDGGLASQVADIIADFQLPCSLKRMGLRHYFPSGKAEDLMYFAGLDTDSIINAAQDEVRREVTGGEDAFVTSIYSMLENLTVSRSRVKAAPFIERLLADKEYLDGLRMFWSERTVPGDKLPTNEQLRQRLGETAKDVLGEALREMP